MPGHKDIRAALAEGDVRIIELTRAQAREFFGTVSDNAKDDEVSDAFDEAQGEADTEGLNTYVLFVIAGGPI